VVFGAFAGYTYWFPKAFGFRLHDGLGRAIFWCWFIGFYLAFLPLYALGLMGATRRMQHYGNTEWQPLMIVAFAGALVILAGIVLTGVQLVVSVRQRERTRDATGDPWDGRTLEWATRSPPPPWNFTALPQVHGLDEFWEAKRRRGGVLEAAPRDGHPLEMPRPSALGVVLAFFSFVMGFALVWHLWALAIVGLAGILAALTARGWQMSHEVEVTGADIAAFEGMRP
jgi:cytochrome o ubiquinol oxidase subunit 1